MYLTDVISSGPHGIVLLVPVSRNIMTGGNNNVLLLPHYDQYIKKIRCKNCTDEPMPQVLVTRNYPLFNLTSCSPIFNEISRRFVFFPLFNTFWSSSYSLMKTAAWKWLSNRKKPKKNKPVYFNVTIYMCITKDFSNLWQTRLMVIK